MLLDFLNELYPSDNIDKYSCKWVEGKNKFIIDFERW